jgi:1-acyl-sn-glycerol-3-phosphate acyltransferase
MEERFDINFYKKFKKFTELFMNTIYDINVNGINNIPNDNYLLAGNHLNILDSWLLISLIDEPIRFMVDKKLYRYKLWETFFSTLGTFPIDPNKMDITAIKKSIELLKDLETVCIFPEGKTHSQDIQEPFKNGVPTISVMAKKQLVPFGISGTYKPLSKLNINFGEPIDYSKIPKSERDEHLETLVRKLEKK